MTHNQRLGRIHEITAVSNPRIKSIRRLAQKKYRDQSGTFLVEGLKLVMDALEHGWQIDAIIYAKGEKEREGIEKLAAKVRVMGADVIEVNDKILTSITRKDNPQAVLGVIRQKWSEAPEKVNDRKTVWIGLDRVRDPGNLGTIIRTADSAGADGIVLIGDTTDPFSIEATRATMGSIFNVPLVRMTEDNFVDWCKSWKGLIVGTHLMGSTDFRNMDYSHQPVLLMMGNEQQGLPNTLSECCNELVRIPMHGAADSLNLAIATGVFLFHMGKRLPEVGNSMSKEKS